jgi:hypothetical protein
MSWKIPRFEFRGLHGRLAACGLERIDLADGRVVIIATELHDSPGVSVTNFAEELATIVCQRFEIDPKKLVWIEHYPADHAQSVAGQGDVAVTTIAASPVAAPGNGARRLRLTW